MGLQSNPYSHKSDNWQSFGISLQGARHVQNEQTCQDAFCIAEKNTLLAICVADGHGDSKHQYSHIGSKIAVEIGCSILLQALEALNEADIEISPFKQEQILQQSLPKRISWEWNQACKKIGHSQGLISDEQSNGAFDGSWSPNLVSFGTTLLGVAISANWMIVYQLGDGDISYIHENILEYAFEEDPEMMSTVTHSLCQTGNSDIAKLRCLPLKAPPKAVFLSSDGIRDCMQGERSHYGTFIDWVQQKIQMESWDETIANLPEWLNKISQNGNGDDITLVFALENSESNNMEEHPCPC